MAAIVGGVSRRSSSVQLDVRARDIAMSAEPMFPRILLVNRRRKEMLEGDSQRRLTVTHRVGMGGPRVHGLDQRLHFPSPVSHPGVVLDDEWLRDAELAFLGWVPAGRFRTPIEINNFRMVDTTFSTGGIPSQAAQ